MEYYLIPINDTNTLINGNRLKDMLYEKFPEIGNLEITKKTKMLISKKTEKKQTKIENKSDKKIDKVLDKLNVPKYMICQKHKDGSFTEINTGKILTFKDSRLVQKFKFDFEVCYEYWAGSSYDEKLANFFDKESELVLYEQKEQKEKEEREEKELAKAKKKTKKKTS